MQIHVYPLNEVIDLGLMRVKCVMDVLEHEIVCGLVDRLDIRGMVEFREYIDAVKKG